MSRRIASSRSAVVLAAERDIRARLAGEGLDFTAMSAVSNIYRAGAAVRHHMEREVLAAYDLSWAAFTVLWVLWIWGDRETGHLAGEAGVTKGTLTGVVTTLAARKLVRRIPHRDDRRRVSVGLTRAGTALIEEIFPIFNGHETLAVGSLTPGEQRELAGLLRRVLGHISDVDRPEDD
ncbi:MAG: MarR family winged helix-turn-helix transcriptional regulator [Acidimicrobiales bacterium]